MAKQSSKKSKANKEAHAKTPKKSGRRVAPAISRFAIPTPILEIRLNPDRALPVPFGGGAPNKIFSIPRSRT
ncbi:hypothetical protein H5410_023952 [Solanum commersonii]|uniref:Uncharacterized protein n=1 Tax=Solanum commersonii TaxID=4109 RepID=A0A9J5ZKL5_SOLCO|nr:hypothetical protein H5410_023952 [Solanum commersonii]